MELEKIGNCLDFWGGIESKDQTIPQTAIQIFSAPNKGGKITPKSIEEAFKKAGFTISANRDMNGPFKKQFKQSDFTTYNLFTFYKKDIVLNLAKKTPRVGLFAPMSMSIYTKKGEDAIHVAMLSAKEMAHIMGLKADDKDLHALKSAVFQALKEALPKGSFTPVKNKMIEPKGKLVTEYQIEIDPKDWEDELEEFRMTYEGDLSTNGFIIAGENDLGDDFDDADFTKYDFYQVYSICKLPVIYTIAKSHPEAGAYAPCSLYIEKEKGEKVMHAAFPSVYNWMSTMGLTDKNATEVLLDAQRRMEKILKSASE